MPDSSGPRQEEPASRLRFRGAQNVAPRRSLCLWPVLQPGFLRSLYSSSSGLLVSSGGRRPGPEGVCMSGLVGELLWGVGVSASRLCWSPSKCVGSPTSPPAVGGVGSRVGQGTESWAILVKSFHSPINGRTNVPSTADQSSSPLWRWNQSSIARRPAQ